MTSDHLGFLIALFCHLCRLGSSELTVRELFNNDLISKDLLVAFISTECPHSQRLLPVWRQLEEKQLATMGSNKLGTMLVNCKNNVEFCAARRILYYPSVHFYPAGQSPDSRRVLKGPRSLSNLLSFVARSQLGLDEEEEEAAAAAASNVETNSGVMRMTDENFDRLTNAWPVLVKFYTDWCPHCRQMAPLFNSLAVEFKTGGVGVSLGSVDCDAHADACSRQRVQHYPTVALYAHGRLLATYEEEHSVVGWIRFVRERLRLFEAGRGADRVVGAVPDIFRVGTAEPTPLSHGIFDSTVGAAELAFVKFYAPWCVHCQRLAPVWSQLSISAASEFGDSVLVASVDCTIEAALCSRHKVRGYPTLLLFSAGAAVDSYKGMRDVEALMSFLRASVLKHARSEEL